MAPLKRGHERPEPESWSAESRTPKSWKRRNIYKSHQFLGVQSLVFGGVSFVLSVPFLGALCVLSSLRCIVSSTCTITWCPTPPLMKKD